MRDDTGRREGITATAGGIEIYDLKCEGLHGFCLCVYAKGGVMYENRRDPGISHFVEHIVFRNINLLMDGKLYDTLDEAGLTFTAATYKEFMQFCITGASPRFSLAADIITLLFEELSPVLSKGDFEAERDRIRAEIREYDEKTSLEYLVKKRVWHDTPLEDMITGTAGSVSKITPAKCERARKALFSKGNFFFYVTGNVSDDDIGYLAEKADRFTFPDAPPRDNVCILPEDFMKRSAEILTKDAGYYMVEMCFDMDTSAASKPARNLFYDLMFAGENCRFFRELSERLGYIYSYDAKIEEYKNAGNISISYEVSLKNLYDSVNAAVELFNELKNDAAGLSRAKVYYTDNAPLMLDNAEELNWTMAYENYILNEGIVSIDDKRRRYEAITEQDVMYLARSVFVRKNLVIGVKGRKKKIDTSRLEEILARLK